MKLRFCILLLFCFIFSTNYAQDNSLAHADSLAIAAYNKILKKDPNNEMALRGKGYSYYRIDSFIETEKAYRKAITVNPMCKNCYARLIDIRNYQGKTEEAIKLADSCIELFKNHNDKGEFILKKAYLLFGTGDDLGAEVLFDKVVRLYPDSAKAYFYRADFRYKTDSKSGALSDINKAIALDSSFASFYTMKAKIYLTIDYIDEALKLTNKSIAIDSSYFDAFWVRANIYSYYQKYDEAIKDMQIVLSKDTSNWNYYSFLSDIYHNKENMDSMCWCDKKAMSILLPQTTTPNYTAYLNTLKHKISAFCDDSKPGYYYQRGVAMYNIGLYDSAVTYYTIGLKKFPKHPVMHSFRANAFVVLQKWDEAQIDFYASISDKDILLESVKERFNDSSAVTPEIFTRGFVASAYAGLSEVFMNKKKYQKALEMADSAILKAPLLPDVPLYTYYNQKGRVYMAQGLYDDAFTSFEKAKMLAPENPLGYMNMALALANKSLGKKELYGGFSVSTNHNNLLGFKYESKPIKLTDVKKRKLKEALTYCDMAVNVAEKQAKPYLIRGYIKHLLGNSTACQDVRKAMYFGNADAAAYYQSICR